jgi:hypothetical protein
MDTAHSSTDERGARRARHSFVIPEVTRVPGCRPVDPLLPPLPQDVEERLDLLASIATALGIEDLSPPKCVPV